jgi:hypothetical protein
VMRLADGTLVAHWLQWNRAGRTAYDVHLAYSKDKGKTWSASFMPHHDGTATIHGFASLFQMPSGGLSLIWLNGRAKKGAHGAFKTISIGRKTAAGSASADSTKGNAPP